MVYLYSHTIPNLWQTKVLFVWRSKILCLNQGYNLAFIKVSKILLYVITPKSINLTSVQSREVANVLSKSQFYNSSMIFTELSNIKIILSVKKTLWKIHFPTKLSNIWNEKHSEQRVSNWRPADRIPSNSKLYGR